jgi:hypothetical protein
MWEKPGVEMIPTRAANMTGRKVGLCEQIIPIQVPIDRSIYPTNDRPVLLRCLKDNIDSRNVMNRNSELCLEIVREKIMTNASKHINGHYAAKEHQIARFREVIAAYENGVARDFGSGGGIDSEGKEVKFWVPKMSVCAAAGIDPNVMYVTAHVPRNDMMAYRIPATTGNEVFAPQSPEDDEDEEEEVVALPVALPIAEVVSEPIPVAVANLIACDVVLPSTSQAEFTEDTKLQSELCRRIIASVESPSGSKYENIYVTPEIYANLKKGGSIYNYVFEVYDILGQKIKIQTKKGRTPKSYEQRGLMKIDSISW